MHDDDDDDRPRSRRRAWEDDEDDRPSRRRDDRPAKSGNALPLILGVVGGVLLLLGGGCAGAYFLGIKPALERVKAVNEQKQREYEELERKEQELLNRPQPPLDPPPRQNPPRPDRLKPAPDKPDEAVAVALADLVDEYIKNPKAAEAKYKDKLVKVTGEVKQVSGRTVTFVDKAGGGYTYQTSATIAIESRGGLAGLKAGDTVTITGKLSPVLTNTPGRVKMLRLTDAKQAK